MRVFHNKVLRLLSLVILLGTALAGTSEASPTITLTPTSQTIALGGYADLDVTVSGLTLNDAVGGFSMMLSFNNSIMSGYSFLNDPDSKMGALPLELSGGFSGGSLDLYFVADASMTQAGLFGLQGSAFRLATMRFFGLSEGLSPVSFSPGTVVLSNWDGTATQPTVNLVSASVCVDDPNTTTNPCATVTPTGVPEASSVVLTLVGLAGLATLAAKRHRLLTKT